MKIKFCVLLYLIISIGCSFNTRENSNFELSDISTRQKVSPALSVEFYLRSSLLGDESLVNSQITRTPQSYWKQCESVTSPDNNTVEANSNNKTDEEWAGGFYDLLKTTSQYVKVNNIKLISIYGERVFKDEAVVFAKTGNQFQNQSMTFYLTLEKDRWKVFLVDSDNSVEPNLFKFAEDRPICE